MTLRQSVNIDKVLRDLRRCRTIPLSYRTALEERLVILCKPLNRQPRRKVPRAIRDNRLHHNQKKAQNVYLQILEEAPGVFLPFLIAISPRACEELDLSTFLQNYKEQEQIQLRNDAEEIFEKTANTHGINESSHYKKLIRLLFPKGSYNNTDWTLDITN